MVFLNGVIHTEIIEGKDLPDLDNSFFRSEKDVSDPFVTVDVIVGGKSTQRIVKTSVIKDNLNPTWNEKFSLSVCHETESFLFTVKDMDLIRAQHMGIVSIQAEDLLSENPISGWFNIKDDSGNPAGSLKISLKYKSKESIRSSGIDDFTNTSEDCCVSPMHDCGHNHENKHWGYSHENGPAHWHEMYPIANGPRQSPIDINEVDKENCPNCLTPVYTDIVVSEIINNGHAWEAKIEKEKGHSSLKGGLLGDEYELEQFHAHWGKTDETGSEHTVNGLQYSAELHMVHWNKGKYASFDEAVNKPDGLAVLGRLIQIGNEAHPELNKICRLLPFIQHKGQKIQVEDVIDPAKFIPKNGSFWTYDGSLTTPPLLETVTWMVYQEPLIISEAQLVSMRMLKTYHPTKSIPADDFGGQMVENYRPPKPLGTRIIRTFNDSIE